MRNALDSKIKIETVFPEIGNRMASSRFASVPAIFFVRHTKEAGAWPTSADCSSAVSRPTLFRPFRHGS